MIALIAIKPMATYWNIMRTKPFFYFISVLDTKKLSHHKLYTQNVPVSMDFPLFGVLSTNQTQNGGRLDTFTRFVKAKILYLLLMQCFA
jgi:hypothetical protein